MLQNQQFSIPCRHRQTPSYLFGKNLVKPSVKWTSSGTSRRHLYTRSKHSNSTTAVGCNTPNRKYTLKTHKNS